MQFGNGNDLEIFHDGTHSHIIETGSGNLAIHTDNILQLAKNDTAGSYEVMGQFVADGAAELYYDGSKKLNTTSTGINIEGTGPRLDFTDTNHNNFAIIVDGNDLNIQDTTAGENRFNINSSGVVSCNDGLFVPDAKSIFLGNSNDLSLKHDGTDSRIINNGSELLIYTVGDHDVKILADSQNAVICKPDGAVELYFDNSKKLETTSTGATISGTLAVTGNISPNGYIKVLDNQPIYYGTGNDLVISHNGSTNVINSGNYHQVHIKAGDTEDVAKFKPNSSVELYYDNAKKFETTSYGVFVNGNLKFDDNNKSIYGNGDDLNIFHDGGHSHILHSGTGNLAIHTPAEIQLAHNDNAGTYEHMVRCIANGAVELYYNGSKKFETKSSGVGVTGNLEVGSGQITCGVHGTTGFQIINDGTFGTLHSANLTFRTVSTTRATIDTSGNFNIPNDTGKIRLGTGNDLQIYHDGSDSYINDAGTGNLYITSTDGNINLQTNGSENAVKCIENGAVELYYDGSKKLETTSWGTQVTGTFKTSGGGISILTDNQKFTAGAGDDLQIFHDGANSYIQNSTGNLIFKNATANYIVNDNSTGAVELYYNGSKKFETTSTGAVISGGLDCSATGQVVAKFEGTGVSDPQIYLGDDMSSPVNNCIILGYDKADNRGYLTIAGDADNTLSISDGNLVGINTTANVEHFNVQGNIRLINPTGTTRRINALPSGSYTLGTSGGSAIAFHRFSDGSGGSDEIAFETHHQGNRHAETARFLKTGGIAFNGDTAAANALDDYEEGTWTVGNASALGGTGRTVNTAVYTKIGNIVTISLNIFASGNDMSTGGVTLSGLPFTVKDHQGIFLGGYNNKDCSGVYINNTNIVIMSGNSGTRHLWTTFSYTVN
jgi:hypothetical protein